MSSQPSISTGTEPELQTAVGSRLLTVEGRYDCVEPALSGLHPSNKKYDTGSKTFQPSFISVFLLNNTHTEMQVLPYKRQNLYLFTILHSLLNKYLVINTQKIIMIK